MVDALEDHIDNFLACVASGDLAGTGRLLKTVDAAVVLLVSEQDPVLTAIEKGFIEIARMLCCNGFDSVHAAHGLLRNENYELAEIALQLLGNDRWLLDDIFAGLLRREDYRGAEWLVRKAPVDTVFRFRCVAAKQWGGADGRCRNIDFLMGVDDTLGPGSLWKHDGPSIFAVVASLGDRVVARHFLLRGADPHDPPNVHHRCRILLDQWRSGMAPEQLERGAVVAAVDPHLPLELVRMVASFVLPDPAAHDALPLAKRLRRR